MARLSGAAPGCARAVDLLEIDGARAVLLDREEFDGERLRDVRVFDGYVLTANSRWGV